MKKNWRYFNWQSLIAMIVVYLLSIQIILAACPGDVEIDQGAGHPDIDLTVRGWVGSKDGVKSLIRFDRGLSGAALEEILDYRKAPQLTTLLEGTAKPAILNLYDVNHWNWDTMNPAGPIRNDRDGLADFASMVGLATLNGQKVLVPSSGYEIGGGYEVMVLYATTDSITIKYTGEDDMKWGYGLHIIGFNVNPEILSMYEELNSLGRQSLPVLCAGSLLGTATGGEIKVAIRDTGSFMDPRWELDWWNTTITHNGQNYPVPTQENTSCPMSTTTPLPTKCYADIPSDSSLGSAKCNMPTPALTGEYRPYPCMQCDLDVPGSTYSCGVPFTFIKQANYACGDINRGRPNDCEVNQVRMDWKADIVIDTSVSKLPFAGYHETIRGSEGYSINPNMYINDYFAGTLGYDGIPINTGVDGYNNWFLEVGVFRKLAPKELMDELKIELIKAGESEGLGYDYKVTNGQITKTLNEFRGNYPPRLEDYLSQVDSNETLDRWEYEKRLREKEREWLDAYNDWLKKPFGQLWEHVPMFVLEDAPAKLEFLVEKHPSTANYERTKNGEIVGDPREGHIVYPMSVPHLARLKEISEVMQKMLLPTLEAVESGEISYLPKNNYIMAAPSFSSVLSEGGVLGQTLGVSDENRCINDEDSGPGCQDINAITDSYPKDPICCSGTLGMDFNHYVVEVPQSNIDACNNINPCAACMDIASGEAFAVTSSIECIEPNYCIANSTTFNETMTRAVSVQFHVPYLKQIYENTIGERGFYNIFKTLAFSYKDEDPSTFVWPDTDAKSNIVYRTQYVDSGSGSVDQEQREIYFPYLGGINQTKKCISENMLAPSDLTGPSSNCLFTRADRSFYPDGRYGDSPGPTYLGDCADIAMAMPDISQMMMESGCFEDFCMFVQGERSNQAVPLGYEYYNPYTDKNQGMWQDPTLINAGIQQAGNIDNTFEQWAESEGKANDNQDPGSCAYMLNLHRSYQLINAGFKRQYVNSDGSIGYYTIEFSNVYALQSATANIQAIDINYVGGQLVVTVKAHAYIYHDGSQQTNGAGANQMYGRICINNVCGTPQAISDTANSPTEITFRANP